MFKTAKRTSLIRTIMLTIAACGATGPVVAGPTQIPIDDIRVFPESLTSTADGTIIIGSLDHGTVYRAIPDAAKASPWIDAKSNGLGKVLGVFADDAASVLWVCTNDLDPNGTAATLKSFDLKTGAPKGSYPFDGGGLCNDIAIERDGTVLATDTRGGRVLALKPGAVALAAWSSDPKWVGIDGIAVLSDGSVLFNNVRQNQLVRVEVKQDGAAGTTVQLELSQPIDGPDGMRAMADGRVVMAENRSGKIDIVKVGNGKATIETIADGFKWSPTAVTVVGDKVWVLEAKFAYRNDPAFKDRDPGQFSVVAVPVPKP